MRKYGVPYCRRYEAKNNIFAAKILIENFALKREKIKKINYMKYVLT